MDRILVPRSALCLMTAVIDADGVPALLKQEHQNVPDVGNEMKEATLES